MIKLVFNRTAFTASASMDDFYREVGVVPYFDDGSIQTLNQVWANAEEMQLLRKAMRKNIRRRAANRGYTKQKNNSIVNDDWMMRGPVHSDKVPRGEIWIYETPEKAKQQLEEKFAEERKGVTT